MSISRRTLLRSLGAGAFANVALPAFSSPWHFELSEMLGAKPPIGPIRLNRNENAYGASPLAIAALREGLTDIYRYPELGDALQEKLANLHQVKPNQVVLGCGSTEILRMSADTFLKPGKKLVIAKPTFPFLESYAKDKGMEIQTVPLTTNHEHDLKAMLAASDASTGLVYICNPNNPTGTLTPRQDLEAFIQKLPAGIPVLIDEAYHHYAGGTSSYVSFLDRPMNDGRVFVARTFSKVYGLAGLRVGYAIAPPEIAQQLMRNRLGMSVSLLSLRAAIAALDDAEHVRLSIKHNADDRQEFFNDANVRMGAWIDSRTNFILLKADHPVDEITQHFKKNNILIGYNLSLGQNQYIRISLGQPEEMKEFWRVWDLLPHSGMNH
ncbi:MAG TPA: aminotransferase class I/II-fold pyridoxal phosphate-dependent enzyme [Candidatus Angelobacter sp.]|nr:aminotransferase class I/II-fold pyridoxal phosphate-dependent enzyme [Candidatus Angelobacter sp.]